jgi:hypothetical protein
MADQHGEAPKQVAMKSLTTSRSTAILALAACFVAGYLFADWLSEGQDQSESRDQTPLEQICARVDHVDSLQENLTGQEAASEEARAEFKTLVEQCRAALEEPD